MTTTPLRCDGLPANGADDGAQAAPERLGETPAFGYRLLELLSLAGWDIAITARPAGGVQVNARGLHGTELQHEGASIADVAVDLFKEAMAPPTPPFMRGDA